MYVILAYDVNAKRVSKVMKICKKYLYRVQNSVFEGYITESKLAHLKKELENKIDTGNDSILIYRMDSTRFIQKEQLGVAEKMDSIIG